MIEQEKRQFFSKMKNKPTTIKGFGGKVSLSNFPIEERRKILNRLAEKDDVLANGLKGELPGLKIDGKQVTRENIHEFEIKKDSEKKVVKTSKNVEGYTKEFLENLSFTELKKIGNKFGTTDRSKKKLIKEILKLQK
jgi:hypothetical protein